MILEKVKMVNTSIAIKDIRNLNLDFAHAIGIRTLGAEVLELETIAKQPLDVIAKELLLDLVSEIYAWSNYLHGAADRATVDTIQQHKRSYIYGVISDSPNHVVPLRLNRSGDSIEIIDGLFRLQALYTWVNGGDLGYLSANIPGRLVDLPYAIQERILDTPIPVIEYQGLSIPGVFAHYLQSRFNLTLSSREDFQRRMQSWMEL